MSNTRLIFPEFKAISSTLPHWCNTHCYKMKPIFNKSTKCLLIKSSTAVLSITRSRRNLFNGWFVCWCIIHAPWSKSRGSVVMDSTELKSAFGLADTNIEDTDWLLEDYGGNSAIQGKYIRCGYYLNIPCPGTGHDGDPNISIKIDRSIKSAIQELLTVCAIE